MCRDAYENNELLRRLIRETNRLEKKVGDMESTLSQAIGFISNMRSTLDHVDDNINEVENSIECLGKRVGDIDDNALDCVINMLKVINERTKHFENKYLDEV